MSISGDFQFFPFFRALQEIKVLLVRLVTLDATAQRYWISISYMFLNCKTVTAFENTVPCIICFCQQGDVGEPGLPGLPSYGLMVKSGNRPFRVIAKSLTRLKYSHHQKNSCTEKEVFFGIAGLLGWEIKLTRINK